MTTPPNDPPTSSLASNVQPPPSPRPEHPFTLRKGISSTHNPNHLYAFTLNCDYLFPLYFSFIYSLDYGFIPKSKSEAMVDHNRQQAMLTEMGALDANNTLELAPYFFYLPTNHS